MSQVLRRNVERRSKALGEQVSQIAEHVRAAIAQTRSLARGLSPVLLDAEGLMTALAELAATTEKLFKVRCLFHCRGRTKVTDHATATHLYRIAQEAVNNAARHAHACLIEIKLAAATGRLMIEVTDDGTGLPEAATRRAGMGLHIMQYRASMIRATLTLARRAERGTVVTCSLPWRASKSRSK